ncbi:serine hydrolase-domain-containing protein [Aspergillus varians]
MRFLCLHSAGTNSKIFDARTAALRSELEGDHTFEFVEGTIPHPKATATERYATSDDEYYAYYDPDSSTSFQTALMHLQSYLAVEGPFDGVLAFSQGVSLVSALLLDRSLTRVPFRCAVFICGRPPPIPTVYVRSPMDPINPKGAEDLWELCQPEMRWGCVYDNEEGYEVPGATDEGTLLETEFDSAHVDSVVIRPSYLLEE